MYFFFIKLASKKFFLIFEKYKLRLFTPNAVTDDRTSKGCSSEYDTTIPDEDVRGSKKTQTVCSMLPQSCQTLCDPIDCKYICLVNLRKIPFSHAYINLYYQENKL